MSELASRLAALERRLDPVRTDQLPGVEIVACGEVSAVLSVAELPGRILKRMSGFPSRERSQAYVAVVERYLAVLRALGVAVVATELVPLEPEPGRHVVYVVQPCLDPQRLGHALLRQEPFGEALALIEGVLEVVHRVLALNGRRSDGREVAIDAQLSNWHWPPTAEGERRPVLLDVATPFMRLRGALEMGTELFLYPFLPPLRWWARRTRAVERYIDDYFHFDRTVHDLLGNFLKEGAAGKLAEAIAFVNAWIARQPDGERLGRVDEQTVRAYYARDAATLEFSLRARRLGRFVTVRLLRRRYDFILPGRIAR